MTELDKLACEWSEKRGNLAGYGAYHGYIAGFLKARAMAFEIAHEYSYREGTKGPSCEVDERIREMGEADISEISNKP